MKKKKQLEYVTHKEFMIKLLSNPQFRKVYKEQELKRKIISALIDARMENKLSQREFSKRIGIAQSALARF